MCREGDSTANESSAKRSREFWEQIPEHAMSKAMKMIENPEVPGLERLLPPPPPQLLPSETAGVARSSEKEKQATAAMQEDFIDSTDVKAGTKSQTDMEQPTAGKQPWWVLTASDNVEGTPLSVPAPEGGTAWMEIDQKDVSAGGNAKGKFFKRKSECIDPAQDAERVADAQKELSALMKPLQCDLCNAIMNSTLQAKLHYDGKPHQKKVSMFLNQSVKKLKPEEGQIASTTNHTDWNTYCDVCKTWFTSLVDASQHYAGKKHIRATTGASKPKTKKPQTSQAPIDPTGRFGIGMSFAPEMTPVIPNPQLIEQMPTMPATVLSPVVSPVNYPNPNWPFPSFRCEPCGVTANRSEQLEAHKRGARHLRMMKLRSLENPDIADASDAQTQPAPSSIDYSIYRTPSGQYYCAPCNRSFHSEQSFAHHTESKKHKTQTNPKQSAPSLASNKKPSKLSK